MSEVTSYLIIMIISSSVIRRSFRISTVRMWQRWSVHYRGSGHSRGEHWKGMTVLARCDNMEVVAIINSGTARDTQTMNLMRCLTFLAATRNLRMRTAHINHKCHSHCHYCVWHNTLADSLSLQLFHSQFLTGGAGADTYPGSSAGSAPVARAGLDGQRLNRAVDYYMGNALAKSTKQVYKSAKERYMLFCMSQHVPLLPASERF